MPTLSRAALLTVAVVGSSTVGLAWAHAQPLTDGSYDLDIVDLPVLGSSRVVGLAGAYASVGEGIAGMASNPGALAARADHERDWFEWDLALGALVPSSADSSHFFGNSDDPVRTEGFVFFDAGLRLQFGPAAFGVLVRPRRFTFEDDAGRTSRLSSQTAHVDLGWTFAEGAYTAGIGVRAVNLDVTVGDDTLLAFSGANVSLGFLARPTGLPFRASFVFRAPVRAANVEVDAALDATTAIPRAARAPWELSLGGAFGFGERPFNVAKAEPPSRRARRRERASSVDADVPEAPAPASAPGGNAEPEAENSGAEPLRPRYGFVTAELLLQGRTPDGVGLDGFLVQQRLAWGRRVTVSPRIAVEGEPWRDRMKLRGGLYVEAARPSVASPRAHFTSGFDLRLFDTNPFGWFDDPLRVQITFSNDVASGYVAFGFGVGLWH